MMKALVLMSLLLKFGEMKGKTTLTLLFHVHVLRTPMDAGGHSIVIKFDPIHEIEPRVLVVHKTTVLLTGLATSFIGLS